MHIKLNRTYIEDQIILDRRNDSVLIQLVNLNQILIVITLSH